MGLSGIGIWQLLIILAIVALLFGTKRLGSIGSDLGSAIRGFRKSMQDDGKDIADASAELSCTTSSETPVAEHSDRQAA
ncbi:MAG: twin-arginine translocase TatA/TatE family subunit [Halieaceae bacterium]|jgi:sec-independent protein translocase protein TatA|nr:twin-arginine translocase TatA/TatE family subunit [Halieaceae bacterium]